MNEFTTTARVTFDAMDVPVGYGVSVTEARALVESGLNTLIRLKEKHSEAMKRFWDKRSQEDEAEEQKRKDLRDRLEEIDKDITTLEGYGTRWFSNELVESDRIDALIQEKIRIGYELRRMRRGYLGSPACAHWDAQMSEHYLKGIQKLLDIVAVETIPVDRDQAMLLSSIKSGDFEDGYSSRYQSDYPVAETE